MLYPRHTRSASWPVCALSYLYAFSAFLLPLSPYTLHAKDQNQLYRQQTGGSVSSVNKVNNIPIRPALRLPAPLTDETKTIQATVTIKVTDKRGKPVTGLSCADLLLKVDKKPATYSFCTPLPANVSIGFALDTSRSVRDIIYHERETALALASRYGPETSVGIVSFGSPPQWLLPFTTDFKTARRTFNKLPPESRRTALFDGVAALLSGWTSSTRDEQRLGIIISDGLDNMSQASAASVIASAQTLDVTFYVIHFPFYEPHDGHLVARPMVSGVKELAEQTGGRYFRVGTAQESLDPRAEYNLRPIFQALEQDVAGRYRIGFTLPVNKSKTRERWQIKGQVPQTGWKIQILREKYSSPQL